MVEEAGSSGQRPESTEGGIEAVEPLDVDGVGTTLVGIVVWALALVAAIVFYDNLREQGRDWWLWTCLAGLGLGLIGFEYCRRRRARIRQRGSQPAAGSVGKRARRSGPVEGQG